MKLLSTKNGIPARNRAEVCNMLADRLADAVDLFTQIKQAHWNVKGSNFIALHELFDKVAEEAEEWGDEIAERAVQLGGTALGTARFVAKNSSLKEYPLNVGSCKEHVDALSTQLAAFSTRVREGIEHADDQGDPATADLLTKITEEADKYVWFIEAHNQ